MKTLIAATLGGLLLMPAARAGDAPKPGTPAPRGCRLADGALVNQEGGRVTIDCLGVGPQLGGRLAGILTYVLQRRLDPELVIARLDEVQGVPPANQPRNLSDDQGLALVQSLVAGKPGVISVFADPDGPEPGNYALALATRLGMAGWRIAGSQIRRTAPSELEDMRGVVLVVHDDKSPPAMAVQLKKSFAAAKLFVPIVSCPDVPPDAALLWVGKRPELDAAATR